MWNILQSFCLNKCEAIKMSQQIDLKQIIIVRPKQMAGSPSRRSPRDNRGKRDSRYGSRSPQDRNYGSEGRKRVHKNYQQEKYPRNTARQSQRAEDKYTDRISVRAGKKEQIQVKSKNPPSQIRIHFRFKAIQIDPNREQELMKTLKNYISSKMGPLQYFQKSYDSYPGFLLIELGFKYDHVATLYLKGDMISFSVKVDGKLLNISAEPTRIFQLQLDQTQAKKRKSKKQSRSKSNQGKYRKSKNRRRDDSSSASKSSSSSSKSRRSRRSMDSRRQKGAASRRPILIQREQSRSHFQSQRQRQRQRQKGKKERERQKGRELQRQRERERDKKPQSSSRYDKPQQQARNGNHDTNQQGSKEQKKYRKLFFFGVHMSVTSKDMIHLLYNHEEGPFYSQQFLWKKMKGSISEYLQGKFQQKQAERLLQLSDKMEVKGHPFIIISAQSLENEKLLQKLSQFQLNIEFPKAIEPYYLLKGLKQCGRLIQIISNNKLTQQGSEYYNVTFNSRQVCQRLKALKKTVKGIIIQEATLDDAIFIYRPNNITQLMTVNYIQDQKNGRNSDNSKEKEHETRNKEYQNRNKEYQNRNKQYQNRNKEHQNRNKDFY